ncbi:MAG: nucleoside triphosphate pyrophosphohydrolase [Fretibacterium sp.]|nr:nucleoside triphosphate pyrophosphohydrolase [Fretibacterium sp.]
MKRENENGRFCDELLAIVERLRAPDGCPWDREQTLESLRTCIVEEAYELTEAITEKNRTKIKEEAGDLLLQIVFLSSITAEQGDFNIADVSQTICDKLIRRHPHVFGDAPAADSDDVLRNWECIKLEERRESNEDLSVLAGIPSGLPPLLKAHRMQGKAAHVGFDWPAGDVSPLFAKLDEEINELREAVTQGDSDLVEDELGDLLFMAVNLARHLKVNPDAALSRACVKFSSRFRTLEQTAAARRLSLNKCSLNELNELWEHAKSHGGSLQ